VRVPRVAGLADEADDGARLDVAEVLEAGEVTVADVALAAGHRDVLAREPVVRVGLREAGERSSDRSPGQRDDVIAPVRVIAADGATLSEVVLVVDGPLDRAQPEGNAGWRLIDVAPRVGVESPGVPDVVPRLLRVAVHQPDPAQAGDQLLRRPRVGRRVLARVPTLHEARRRQDKLISIVAQPRTHDRL